MDGFLSILAAAYPTGAALAHPVAWRDYRDASWPAPV